MKKRNIKYKLILTLFILIPVLITLKFCCPRDKDVFLGLKLTDNKALYQNSLPIKIEVNHDITIKNYFQFLDSIVQKYGSVTPYNLTEHLLVHANFWLIDTLQNTDYYRMMERDSFVYDQKELIVLKKGSRLIIPDSIKAHSIINSFKKTTIDINVPEFRLRIIKDTMVLYEFPVRVGRNEKKYLKMGNRITDLKTKTGKGQIVNHVKNPSYYNPVNGRRYYVTKRDDEKVTKLPQIPFIETEINGVRIGQLIHPTTNPKTLNKAYSNGCIGTKEADAWVIYYHAPIGTNIIIRYDLNVIDSTGSSMGLKDIYSYYE